MTKETSLVVWGGGVVVGSPQGSLPISTVHAHATEKLCCYIYYVPYGTIVDPSQVSLWLLQCTIQPHLAWNGTRKTLLFDMPWFVCYAMLLSCLSCWLYFELSLAMLRINYTTVCLLHGCWFVHGKWFCLASTFNVLTSWLCMPDLRRGSSSTIARRWSEKC